MKLKKFIVKTLGPTKLFSLFHLSSRKKSNDSLLAFFFISVKRRIILHVSRFFSHKNIIHNFYIKLILPFTYFSLNILSSLSKSFIVNSLSRSISKIIHFFTQKIFTFLSKVLEIIKFCQLKKIGGILLLSTVLTVFLKTSVFNRNSKFNYIYK